MSSPIVQATTGYLVHHVGRSLLPKSTVEPIGPIPRLLLVSLVFSLLPDVDADVHWSDGLIGTCHLWTPLTELVFIIAVGALGLLAKTALFTRIRG